MPYTINNSYGTPITTVADGTVDNTTSLKLIGKNYAGYGEIQNENFLFLLENFANGSAPNRSIAGQIWFDSANSKLKFNDGSKWRTTGGAEVGDTQPAGLTVGDFWWDTKNKQLYASNGGTSFTLVGPQGVAGSGTTQMRSRSLVDLDNISHPVIEAVTNGVTTFIIWSALGPGESTAPWKLNNAINEITGFEYIHQGITLAYAGLTNTDGVSPASLTSQRFWGTASNADSLGQDKLTADSLVTRSQAVFTDGANFSDNGYYIGGRLRVFNSLNSTPTFHNQLTDSIVFKTNVAGPGGGEKTPMQLVGPDIKPGFDQASDLGASGLKFKTVYAYTFDGEATKANKLALGNTWVSATDEGGDAATAGTIVARTREIGVGPGGISIPKGSIKAAYFVGTATAANYADLAENYLADTTYEVGTVVAVGGEKEVTACNVGQRALGAVSEKPAYLMNSELVDGTPIALKGRVPVKVTGSIIKGQRIVAGPNGTAQASFGNHADVFGIALESSDDVSVKLVECVIL